MWPLEAALEALGRAGRAGLLLAELWPALRAELDAAVRALLWSRLREHGELSFVERRGAERRVAREELRGLELHEVEHSVAVVASERLRFWALKVTKETWAFIPDDAKIVLEQVGKGGHQGVLQAKLPALCQIPANKLFYAVRVLQRLELVCNTSVWVNSDSGVVITSGNGTIRRTEHPTAVKSNLLRLPSVCAVASPTPLGSLGLSNPWHHYVNQLYTQLRRTLHHTMTYLELRAAIGLSGRHHETMWARVKSKACELGGLEEVHVRKRDGRKLMCLRLLEEKESDRKGATPLIDRHPLAQMLSAVEASGSVGVLSVTLRDMACCAGKHYERVAKALSQFGVVRQREILNRGVAYRYFTAHGAAKAEDFVDADKGRPRLMDGAGGGGGGGAPAHAGAVTLAAENDACDGGEDQQDEADTGQLTKQHEERKKWVLELLAAETAASELTVRIWINLQQRAAGQRFAARIDRKTVRRLRDCFGASEMITHSLPRPQHWPMSSEDCITVLALPGTTAESPAVARVAEELRTSPSPQQLMRNTTARFEPRLRIQQTVVELSQAVLATEVGGHAQMVEHKPRARDDDGVQALALQLGYLPAKAVCARKLHTILCKLEEKLVTESQAAEPTQSSSTTLAERGPPTDRGEQAESGGCETPINSKRCLMSDMLIVEHMSTSDFLMILGLAQLPDVTSSFIKAVRAQGGLRVAELPSELRLPLQANRRPFHRLRQLLRLLDVVGVVRIHQMPGQQQAVELTDSASHEWYLDVLEMALDKKVDDEELMSLSQKSHKLRDDSSREHFWDVLQKLTNQKSRNNKGKDGGLHLYNLPDSASQVSEGGRTASTKTRPSAHPNVNGMERATRILNEFRATSWSDLRPLTPKQRERLLDSTPQTIPADSSELLATADRLGVHPQQLCHFVRSRGEQDYKEAIEGETQGANASSVTHSWRMHKRRRSLGAASASRHLDREGNDVRQGDDATNGKDGLHSISNPQTLNDAIESPDMALPPRTEGKLSKPSTVHMVLQSRTKRKRGVSASVHDSHAKAPAPAPPLAELQPPAKRTLWNRAHHEALIDAFSSQLVSQLASRPAAPLVSSVEPPLSWRGDPTTYKAIEAVLSLIDWQRAASTVGHQPLSCYKLMSRLLRSRRTSSHSSVRALLASKMLDDLQHHKIWLQKVTPDTVASQAAIVVTSLGIQIDTGRLLPPEPLSVRVAPQPRKLALMQLLLDIVAISEADYCEEMSTMALARFSREEIDAGIQALLSCGWLAKLKGGGGRDQPHIQRRYKLSLKYSEQLNAPLESISKDAIAFGEDVADALSSGRDIRISNDVSSGRVLRALELRAQGLLKIETEVERVDPEEIGAAGLTMLSGQAHASVPGSDAEVMAVDSVPQRMKECPREWRIRSLLEKRNVEANAAVEDDMATLIPILHLHCRPMQPCDQGGSLIAAQLGDDHTIAAGGGEIDEDIELFTGIQFYQVLTDEEWERALQQLQPEKRQVLASLETAGDSGMSSGQVALQLGIPVSCARTWLRDLRSESLVAAVPMGDELRYVAHPSRSCWASRPFELVPADKAERVPPVHRPRVSDVTPSGKRPLYNHSKFYVPQPGVLLGGSPDVEHNLKLKHAIARLVAANPGISEANLVAHFPFLHPIHVRSALQQMKAEKSVWLVVVESRKARLFGKGSVESTRCWFVTQHRSMLAL